MPVAVVSDQPTRFELKTLPGGYVDIRRMSYGEKMQRRSFNSKMNMLASKGKKDVVTELNIFNAQAELYDFKVAIVGHNLTDANDNPLDLTNPMQVQLLDGRIAEEIGTYIDRVNNFEEDDEAGK